MELDDGTIAETSVKATQGLPRDDQLRVGLRVIIEFQDINGQCIPVTVLQNT